MATEACDYKLQADIAPDCDNPQVQGLMNVAYLVNFDDIDRDNIVKSPDNPNIVQTLPLKTGKRAYKCIVPGKTPYTGTQSEFAAGTYRNKYNKTAAIVVLDSGPDVSHDVIDPIANGKFVFIFENKYQGKDKKNTFEIYGLEQGLSQTEGSQPKYSDDYDGGWSITLQEANAPTSGIFLFDTDINKTRAALESLVAGNTPKSTETHS